MTLTQLDNIDFEDQINDLYPLENYLPKKKNIRHLILNAYRKQTTKQIQINYNRLKEIKQSEIRS